MSRQVVLPSCRTLALGAALSAAGGALTVAVAVIARPGPGLTGYVSESGVGPSRYAVAYQLGVWAVAVGLLLLASALRPARLAAGLLVAAATATAVSGTVTCRDGCPLPPHDPVTATDLVHGGASVTAVAACVFAMIILFRTPARLLGPPAAARSLRRLALAGMVLSLPLSAAVGLSMVLVGGNTLVGLLERVLLLVVITWCVATAVALAGQPVHPRRTSQRGDVHQNRTVAKDPAERKPHRS